jgi:poly-gamma-glutamate synthesis protein (capsule biosynthesis protein)
VDGFRLAGYDVMTVATNHVKDCGASSCGDVAFLDTLANLRAAGIAPVGGGRNLAEARAPAVIEANGVRFAFLGYDAIAPHYHAGETSAGTAPLREDDLREDVTSARANAEVVVVLPQWGIEYTSVPTVEQRRLGHMAIEAGATLVVGNHPHQVQANEVFGDAFVAYALGNFVFDQDWSVETEQGAILEAVFWGARLRSVRYHPVRIVDRHQPVFAGPDEARQIVARILEVSAALNAP